MPKEMEKRLKRLICEHYCSVIVVPVEILLGIYSVLFLFLIPSSTIPIEAFWKVVSSSPRKLTGNNNHKCLGEKRKMQFRGRQIRECLMCFSYYRRTYSLPCKGERKREGEITICMCC